MEHGGQTVPHPTPVGSLVRELLHYLLAPLEVPGVSECLGHLNSGLRSAVPDSRTMAPLRVISGMVCLSRPA